jgi:hypothetical protein
VLHTFALALREAETWDSAPLVGPGILLHAPERDGLSEAMRELVMVADTEEHDGRRPAWTGIIAGELGRARDIQRDSVGLRFREVEQAVVATFLHSQPIGQSPRSCDLLVLLGATRPDRIELEKGLMRWAQASFWLDDQHTAVGNNQLPNTWRLGNRPNLTQMHAVAAGRVSDDVVRARLLDEIDKVKSLTAGASAAGVRVHTLPARRPTAAHALELRAWLRREMLTQDPDAAQGQDDALAWYREQRMAPSPPYRLSSPGGANSGDLKTVLAMCMKARAGSTPI